MRCRSLPKSRFIRFRSTIPVSKAFDLSSLSASSRRDFSIDLAKLDCLSSSFRTDSSCLEWAFLESERRLKLEWVEMELFLVRQLTPVAATELTKLYIS